MMFSHYKIFVIFFSIIIYVIGNIEPSPSSWFDDTQKAVEVWINDKFSDPIHRYVAEIVHLKWLNIGLKMDDLLEKKNIALKAWYVKKCEEDVEQGLFPYWLRLSNLTRYEKWLIGIAVCDGKFMKPVRNEIIEQYPGKFEVGASGIAKAISDLYDDVSKIFAHPVTMNEIRIPTDKTETDNICNAVVVEDMMQIMACQLIFRIRTIINRELDHAEGQGIRWTENAILYGIVRVSSNFNKVRELLNGLKTVEKFESCDIKTDSFYNLMDKHEDSSVPWSPKVVTFKATCAKFIKKSEFCNHIKTSLKPFMYGETDEAVIQIYEDPFNMADQM